MASVSAACAGSPTTSATSVDNLPPVVLLHGLARSARSMQPMADALVAGGRRVCNIDYPSTDHPIDVLAREHVAPAVADCADGRAVDAVTHSMGGILVRALVDAGLAQFDRVVMLAPPNTGSELVDALGDWRLFGAINGPAGRQLGTDPASLPNRLGPVDFDTLVIAGNRSFNPLYSALIPGPDDGKVAVARTRVDGMTEHHTIAATHTFIMRNAEAIRLTQAFLSRSDAPLTDPGGARPAAKRVGQ